MSDIPMTIFKVEVYDDAWDAKLIESFSTTFIDVAEREFIRLCEKYENEKGTVRLIFRKF